jgi:hypothetical protein
MKKNTMVNKILGLISLSLLSACNGGGGGSSGGGGGGGTTPTTLVPLTVTTTDLNNNVLPYVDISLLGSHTEYKLKFTNPNSVAVTVPFPTALNTDFADQNWIGNQINTYGANYLANYNPGAYYTSSLFTKTSNADDCFNTSSIASGGYCAFYTYAYNMGKNNTSQSTFNYPLAYNIYTTDRLTMLVVQQCNSLGGIPTQYNCSNESAPGYSNQFITYKMLPVNGSTNITANNYGYISNAGNYSYSCNGANCASYPITYNSGSNSLNVSSTPSNTFTLATPTGVSQIYPSLAGTQAWVTLYDNVNGYRLINSESPSVILSSQCYSSGNSQPCVPNINTTPATGQGYGIVGLDGSFWWVTGISLDVYVPSQHTFVTTNAYGGAVNADGTLILGGQGAGCYRTSGGYTSYTKQNMANYVPPYQEAVYITTAQYNYLEMQIPNLVTADGGAVLLYGYYKVHTENGLCQVEPDDYITPSIGGTSTFTQYGLVSSTLSSTAFVTPIANIYQGQ